MIEEEFPEVILIRSNKNLGFAGGNNLALRKCIGRYILLLNSDAYISQNVLESTMFFMNDHPETGILGVKLTNEDGSMQPSARILPTPFQKFITMSGIASVFKKSKILSIDYTWWDHSKPKNVGWVPGAYFLIRKEVTERIGFLDERYFLYFEEIDFCLQTQRAGWKVTFFPDASVVHLGGQSSITTKKQITNKGKQLINLRIKNEFRYYRKNFTLGKVLNAAFVEVFLKSVVWIKNFIIRKADSELKKEEAAIIIGLIFSTLKNDKFGKETIP
jgi:GT2 family glycosyltransferase